MRVFINPGHAPCGIPDPGAVNKKNGARECDIAKNVGVVLASILKDIGYNVKLLQSDDLQEICDEANWSDADIFVSIHCNAFPAEAAHGTETWYYASSAKSMKLAAAVQANIIKDLNTVDRGIKATYGLYVLKHTVMPAVLVELAFITNNNDCELLLSRQAKFANAIANGIADYVSIK